MPHLAVSFHPFDDESTIGWLYRLASANATAVKDFHTHSLGGKPLIELLCDESAVPQPKNIALSEELQTFIFRHFAGEVLPSFSGRYCPFCFSNDETPYFREAWSHQWISHCLEHNTPLILRRCINCGLNGSGWIDNWRHPWGICTHCKQRYSSNEVATGHTVFATKIKPHIPSIISIFESAFNNKNIDLFKKLVVLKGIVERDHTHYNSWKYGELKAINIEPLKYRCCKKDNYDKPDPDGIEDDAAYVLALESISGFHPSLLPPIFHRFTGMDTIRELEALYSDTNHST